MGRKKLNPLLMFGASYETYGVHVKDSWKYELVVDYLKASPSYGVISRAIKRGYGTSNLNADGRLIAQVVQDFGSIYKLQEIAWWEQVGMHLYGVRATPAQVQVEGVLSETNSKVLSKFKDHESLVITLPLGLTITETLKQVKSLSEKFTFAASSPSHQAPKYRLLPSKLTRRTLQLGLEALRIYQAKNPVPLWEIGHRLKLVPLGAQKPTADEKKLLSVAASRLIRTAALVAENAARGRFPCARQFKGAALPAGKRPIGRPPLKSTPSN